MIPESFDKMVFSVPHSGTTSLAQHLGLYMGGRLSGYRHFGNIHAYHQGDIDSYKGQAHIPIRDPLEIAMSWDARYDDEAHNWDVLQESLERMIAYDRPGTVYWHTADLPMNKAKGRDHSFRAQQIEEQDPDIFTSPRIQRLVEWYTCNTHVQRFYEAFFPEFWWV